MSKFENLTAKADARIAATDVEATTRTYASVTDMRIDMAPIWAALTVTSVDEVRRSLADVGKLYDEPKPTVDRYVRLGLVLLALDKVSDKQRAEIFGLVNASDKSRGRISTDAIKAVANEATSATDAIARLTVARDEAATAHAEAEAEKAEKAEAEKAEAEAAESVATDAEVIAGFAGIVSALTARLVTMGPDEVESLAGLTDGLASAIAARLAEYDRLMESLAS